MPTPVGPYVAAARQYLLNTVMTAGRKGRTCFNPACIGVHGSVPNFAPPIPPKSRSRQVRGADRRRGSPSR